MSDATGLKARHRLLRDAPSPGACAGASRPCTIQFESSAAQIGALTTRAVSIVPFQVAGLAGALEGKPAAADHAEGESELLKSWTSLEALEKELSDVKKWIGFDDVRPEESFGSTSSHPAGGLHDAVFVQDHTDTGHDEEEDDVHVLEEVSRRAMERLRAIVHKRVAEHEDAAAAEQQARLKVQQAELENAQLRAMCDRSAAEAAGLRAAVSSLRSELQERATAAAELTSRLAARDAEVAQLSRRAAPAAEDSGGPASASASASAAASQEHSRSPPVSPSKCAAADVFDALQQQLSELRVEAASALPDAAQPQPLSPGNAARAARKLRQAEIEAKQARAAAEAAEQRETQLLATLAELSGRVTQLTGDAAQARAAAEEAEARAQARVSALEAELEAARRALAEAEAREGEHRALQERLSLQETASAHEGYCREPLRGDGPAGGKVGAGGGIEGGFAAGACEHGGAGRRGGGGGPNWALRIASSAVACVGAVAAMHLAKHAHQGGGAPPAAGGPPPAGKPPREQQRKVPAGAAVRGRDGGGGSSPAAAPGGGGSRMSFPGGSEG